MSRTIAFIRRLRLTDLWPGFHPRPSDQLAADLDDEIAFHLESTARRLMAEGHAPDAARRLAEAGFGDVSRIKRQCANIALKEQLMLQRINFILMIAVVLLLIGIGVQTITTQRQNAKTLEVMGAQIVQLRAGSAATMPSVGPVYIDGDIARPGTYMLPQVGRLTVWRLIAASGGVLENRDARVTVFQVDDQGNSFLKFKTDALIREQAADYVLSPGDHVHVERLSTDAEASDIADALAHERARADALNAFLQNVLTSPDPNGSSSLTAREVLEQAAIKAEQEFANDPQTLETVRKLIESQLAALPPVGADQQSPPETSGGGGSGGRGGDGGGAGAAGGRGGDGAGAAGGRGGDGGGPGGGRGGRGGAGGGARGGEEADDPERDIKVSPFELVAWHQWTPYARLDDRWYRVDSIDDVPASVIVDHCRRIHRGKERKRFGEDLVQVLGEMGRDVGQTVKLELLDAATQARLTVDAAPLTKENRTRIWETNNRAEGADRAGYPAFDLQAGRPIELPPAALDQPRSSIIPVEDAHRDLDQLRGHMLDQFSYLCLSGVDLDAAVNDAKALITDPIDSRQFAIRVQKFIAQFGDGHAGVDGLEDAVSGGFAPFLVGSSGAGAGGDGRLVAFKEDRSGFIDPAHPSLRSIDGLPIDRWMAAAETIVPRGSPQLVRGRAVRVLRFIGFLRSELGLPQRPTIDLELESIDRASLATVSLALADRKPIYGDWPRAESRILPGAPGIGYLRLPRMDDSAAPHVLAAMRQFRETAGLIIDVRGNGGGSRTALQVLFPYLMPPDSGAPYVANAAVYRLSRSFSDDHLAARDLYRADDPRWTAAQRRAIETFARTFKPQWSPPVPAEFSELHYFVLDRAQSDLSLYHYDRPVVVLMDEGCFSATDIMLGALKGWPNVTLLGQSSGGGSGRKRAVSLDRSGVTISLSSMISFRPTGELYDALGIPPDVVVERAPTDFTGQTDTQLEHAIALLRER